MDFKNSLGSYFSPWHINASDAVNLFAQPQKQWMWHLIIPDLPKGIDTGLSAKIGGFATSLDNIKRSAQLAMLCKSVNLPKKVIETVEVYFMGRKKKIPMAATYEDNTFEIVFEEREHQAVYMTFTRWIDVISNTVSSSGGRATAAIENFLKITKTDLGSDYKELEEYSSDIYVFMEHGMGVPNNMINIKKCWPININQQNSLDYSGNQSIMYTVTFAFNEYSFISRQDIL